ncbi:hypothetical protein AB6D11_06100 [Vibrio splendidus]
MNKLRDITEQQTLLYLILYDKHRRWLVDVASDIHLQSKFELEPIDPALKIRTVRAHEGLTDEDLCDIIYNSAIIHNSNYLGKIVLDAHGLHNVSLIDTYLEELKDALYLMDMHITGSNPYAVKLFHETNTPTQDIEKLLSHGKVSLSDERHFVHFNKHDGRLDLSPDFISAAKPSSESLTKRLLQKLTDLKRVTSWFDRQSTLNHTTP